MLNKRVTWKMTLADMWRMAGLSTVGTGGLLGRLSSISWARNDGDLDQLSAMRSR